MDCKGSCQGSAPTPPATAAELKIRVLLQSPKASPTENDLNEVDFTDDANWQQQGGRRCKVRNNPGREQSFGPQMVEVATFQVVLRYDSTTRLIDGTWRLVRPRGDLPSVIWKVDSATNWNELNQWMILRCTVRQ